MPGGQENARDRFNMPGMLITHGYLPPIKPDKYVHTTIALELCLGTMAEIIRPAWDEWDYGGDINFSATGMLSHVERNGAVLRGLCQKRR